MMGNKDVPSCNLVSAPTVQELELSLSTADDNWAEAIEMCLAHLADDAPTAEVDSDSNPAASAVSLELRPENLSNPATDANTPAPEGLPFKELDAENRPDTPIGSEREFSKVSASLAEPESASFAEKLEEDATLTNEIIDNTISPYSTEVMATYGLTIAAQEIAQDNNFGEELLTEEVMAFSAPATGTALAEEQCELPLEEQCELTLEVDAETEAPSEADAEVSPAQEVAAAETLETADIAETTSQAEADAESCAVTEWPKLEDLNLDEFELPEEEDEPSDSALHISNAPTKAIEAFTPPHQLARGEPSAARALGPAIAELVAARAEIRRLEMRYENLEQLHYEASKTLYRRQADFDNYRRRVERERDEIRPQIIGEVMKPLLPVVDNLLRALAARGDAGDVKDSDSQNFVHGVQLIAQQLEAAMAAIGIKVISATGEPFNPEVHEAVALETTAEYPPHTVTEEILRGYQFGQHLLRPSMVKVSTLPVDSPSGDN